MAVVKYIARRSLMLSVSIGDQVIFDLPVKYAGLTPQRESKVTTRESMTGARESYYYRGKVSYSVSTIPVSSDVADRMRQFLDSVEDGQVFSFAPNAFSTTPSPEYRNVVVDMPNYSSAPHPSRQELTVFSPFTLVEVP